MINTLESAMDPPSTTSDPFPEHCQQRLNEIWSYVRASTGSTHDAEDIAHDVFLHACAKRQQFAGGDLGAWLYQIARTQVALHFRRKDVERRAKRILQDYAASSAPRDEESWADYPELLNAAMLSLEETEREALRLKFSRAYSNQEIAHLLGIDPSTLGVIVFRALRKLRQILERKDR